MKALDRVETSEKNYFPVFGMWLPDHISMQEPSHTEVIYIVSLSTAWIDTVD